MAFSARVVADSVSSAGVRLVSVLATYPRIIHAEVMTHRVFSRNAESSRAIPVERRIESITIDPFIPAVFGKNQRGMQAGSPLDKVEGTYAERAWRESLAAALEAARELARQGVHKQLANRVLEPYSWITTLITATQWGLCGMPGNFGALRLSPLAQPEFQTIAGLIQEAIYASSPDYMGPALNQWHTPFMSAEEVDTLPETDLLRVCVARCARLSYLTHEGVRDINKDLELYAKLRDADPPHASAFEHCARPMTNHGTTGWSGNFRGWIQYRQEVGV